MLNEVVAEALAFGLYAVGCTIYTFLSGEVISYLREWYYRDIQD